MLAALRRDTAQQTITLAHLAVMWLESLLDEALAVVGSVWVPVTSSLLNIALKRHGAALKQRSESSLTSFGSAVHSRFATGNGKGLLTDQNAKSEGANKYVSLVFECGQVFNPGSPLNERDLFAGRSDQIGKLVHAVSQKGYHAILFGERGVGKTSLSKVLVDYLKDVRVNILMPRANCDASDDFSSLWSKVFRDVVIPQAKPGFGFTAAKIELPEQITPDDVRRALTALGDKHMMVIIFDEFDRIKNKVTTVMMADTIKTLSDHGIQCTILLIGVAESIDELIQEHKSIERALVQVHLPRMTDEEVKEIIAKGLSRLTMEITRDALNEAATLCQGLPYVTHLLALHSAREALKDQNLVISLEHIQRGVRQSLSQWQQSVISAYINAVRSHQPGNIFKEVLAACAMAKCDYLGYFNAAAIRGPLRIMTGHNYDIRNFSRHLNKFTKAERGPVLERTGETRRVRYRFVSPLIKPYVTMRSVADGLLTHDSIVTIKGSEA